MQPFSRKMLRPAISASVNARQLVDGGGSKVEIGRKTTTRTTAKKANILPTVTINGCMSIFFGGWAGQDSGWTGSAGISGMALMQMSPSLVKRPIIRCAGYAGYPRLL